MNQWKVSGILKRDAVKVDDEGELTINFTMINSEKAMDAQGNYTKPVKTYIDCQWIKPDLSMLHLLTEGAFVHLQGKPYLRKSTRSDNTEVFALAMAATYLWYERHLPAEKGPQNRS